MERGNSGSSGRFATTVFVLILAGLLIFRVAVRLRNLPPGPVAISASALPRAPSAAPPHVASAAPRMGPLRLLPAVAEPDLSLPLGFFEGRVLSGTTGQGVPGAALTFAHAGVTASVTADPEGAFRFTPLEAGVHRLSLVTAAGHLPFAPAWGHSPITFVASPGERVRGIAIYLAPAEEYVGVVRDPAGKPVEGAAVRILDQGSSAAAHAGAADRLVSDARGEVHFTAPEDALIEARHPSYSPARVRLNFSIQASRRVVLKLGEQDGGAPPAEETIEGRAVDGRGAAVAGALVSATFADDPPRRADIRPAPQALTDDEGRFVLEGLDPGHYDVVAVSEGLTPGDASGVAAGSRDLVLRLGTGGTLRGTVRDKATHEPIAGFTVIVSTRVGPLERRPFSRVAVFDASGRYEVNGLTPGAYSVSVAAHGYAPSAEASAVIASPPGEPGTLDFALSRGGRVSGMVIEEGSGKPVADARISVEGSLGGGAPEVPVLAGTTTDASGRFELRGLSAGLHSITVVAAGHHGRIISGLAIADDGELGPVTVKLNPTKPGEEARIELTGIGAVLSPKGDALVIGETMEGGGAREAGLVGGDAIVGIDGAAVKDIGFEGSVQRIRGPEGSKVVLTVRKGGAEPAVEVVVVRRRIGA
jgi:hypothetical protein